MDEELLNQPGVGNTGIVRVHRQRLERLFDTLQPGDVARPKFLVYESKDLAAVTTGQRTLSIIAISTGLMKALDDKQLRATIAHELGHITGGHMILSSGFLATMLLAKSLFGAMGLPVTVMLLLGYLALLRRNEIDADRRGADLAGDDDVVHAASGAATTPACEP
jgi:Zn-dependent protease with chaperone function